MDNVLLKTEPASPLGYTPKVCPAAPRDRPVLWNRVVLQTKAAPRGAELNRPQGSEPWRGAQPTGPAQQVKAAPYNPKRTPTTQAKTGV
jgi:hypothetical protein